MIKRKELHFDQMNEADVREELLAPLLDHLGYRSGTEGNVFRELSLRYPRSFLGRKKLKTDPYLRGRADYVLEVKGHARWVLEAKAPNENIDQDAIEQAWSYASHAEVGAVYFAISNGRKFYVFRTSAPPQSPPIIELDYEGVIENITRIEQVLGAEAIRRDFADTHEVGEPIGAGLRSIVKIASGSIAYTDSSVALPIINELQIAIIDGAIERGLDGNLIAFVIAQAPIRSIQEMIERLGLNRLEYISESNVLSSDAENPTEFAYEGHASFPAGEELFDMNSGRRVRIEATIECDLVSRAKMHLVNSDVVGSIENRVIYSGGVNFEMTFSGNIAIRLI